MASTLADTVNDFFVGEDGSEGRAPIHKCIGLKGQSVAVLVIPDGFVALRRYLSWDR